MKEAETADFFRFSKNWPLGRFFHKVAMSVYVYISDLLKLIYFARSELTFINFCAELCTEIAQKTNDFFFIVKLCPEYEKSSCFASYAFKSKNFAQILENFARTFVRMSVRFRSSDIHV